MERKKPRIEDIEASIPILAKGFGVTEEEIRVLMRQLEGPKGLEDWRFSVLSVLSDRRNWRRRLEKLGKDTPTLALTSGRVFRTRRFLKVRIHNLPDFMERELTEVLTRWNRALNFTMRRSCERFITSVGKARRLLYVPLRSWFGLRPCCAHPLISETLRLYVPNFRKFDEGKMRPEDTSTPYFVVNGLKIVHREDGWTARLPHPFQVDRYLVLPIQDKDIDPYLRKYSQITSTWTYVGKDEKDKWWLVVPVRQAFYWQSLLKEEL